MLKLLYGFLQDFYSFLTQIFCQMVVLERECRNLGFKKIVKIMSPISFEFVARTHVRVLYSCPRLMVGHFERWNWVWLLKILWNWGGQLFWNCCSASCMASIFFFNTDFSLMGYCRKVVYEAWCWKDCESSLFCWDSSMTSILIFMMDFFTVDVLEKKYVKKNQKPSIPTTKLRFFFKWLF